MNTSLRIARHLAGFLQRFQSAARGAPAELLSGPRGDLPLPARPDPSIIIRIVSAAGGHLMTKRIEDDGAERARLRALVAGSLLTLAIFPALGVAAAPTAAFPA